MFVDKIKTELMFLPKGGLLSMFADFSKKEFLQTAAGAVAIIIIGYLSMLGMLVIIQ